MDFYLQITFIVEDPWILHNKAILTSFPLFKNNMSVIAIIELVPEKNNIHIYIGFNII